jgi:hypothetical protein
MLLCVDMGWGAEKKDEWVGWEGYLGIAVHRISLAADVCGVTLVKTLTKATAIHFLIQSL